MFDPASSTPSINYKWKEISDLPQDLDSLRDRELESLRQMWTKEKDTIGDKEQVKDFNAQLAREWAIETGIIEGVYTLDRGITQTLIERGIDSAYIPHDATNRDPELVARIIQAHAEVLEGLFAFITGERSLSTGYIKELHAALLRHQDTVVVWDQFGQAFEKQLEKGCYKRMPNNPMRADGSIHEYCPAEHVASEMDRLVELHRERDSRGVLPHIEAAWLHHAFTQIHPFQDGNGRVARALASLVFIKSGFFPLVVNRDDREKYIDSLELADRGNLFHLVRLFAKIQKRSLTKAIGGAVDIKPVGSLEEALTATREMLIGLGRIIPAEYLAAKETANVLVNQTAERLDAVTKTLTRDIGTLNPSFTFEYSGVQSEPIGALRSVTEKLQSVPNVNDYHKSIALTFIAGSVASRIVVSFHSVGYRFRGMVEAVAYLQVGDGPSVPVCEDVFRVSYEEPKADAEKRYAGWLDQCLMQGLAEWRRTLL